MKSYFFPLKKSLISSFITISSLNTYAPVLGDLSMRMHFVLVLPSPFWRDATAFFAMSFLLYLAVYGDTLEDRIVFTTLQTIGSVLLVLRGDVPRRTRHPRLLMLGAL